MSGAVYDPADGTTAAGACRLNVGDTWLEPFAGARMEDLRSADHPGLHRYSDPRGLPELVDAIVEKARAHNRIACERDSVFVGAGATGVLAAAVDALVRRLS
jgi:aspartate/methionine/tyrosine aminotransferase